MRLVVERISAGEIEGWGVDDADPGTPLRIEVALGERLLTSVAADMPRPDLARNGVGNGQHGFVAKLSGSDFLDVLAALDQLSIRGVGHEGNAVPAHIYKTADIRQLAATFTGERSTITLIGDSYIKDNIGAFGWPASSIETPAVPTVVVVLGVKLQIFGDAWWWTADAAGTREPTAEFILRMLEPAVCQRIARGELLLLLDMSNEAPNVDRDAEWLRMFMHALDARGVLGPNCILVTQNHHFGSDLAFWLREQGLPRCRVLQHDYYVRRFVGLSRQRLGDDDIDARILAFTAGLAVSRSRAFVCLNFTPRPERTAFVAWLIGSGLLKNGFVSFKGFSNHKLDNSLKTVPDWFPDRKALFAGLQTLSDLGPLTIDVPLHSGDYTPEFDVGPAHIYAQSSYSIVTESDFSAGEIARITEKSIKPTTMFHPFVLVGNPGSLKLLRDLGFQTFDPLIDERYDLEVNPARRMRMIQCEIHRLQALGRNGRRKLLVSLADRLVHNFIHAHRTLDLTYRHVIEPALGRQMADAGSFAKA